jgi:hypothetical protein
MKKEEDKKIERKMRKLLVKEIEQMCDKEKM